MDHYLCYCPTEALCKPVMSVRLSVRRCLRILGVEIVFPEIKQRAIYCPCCAHRETDVMKIVALAGV